MRALKMLLFNLLSKIEEDVYLTPYEFNNYANYEETDEDFLLSLMFSHMIKQAVTMTYLK